ncbi:MAG TPA: Type 1 glutamine amidotransferase-like domain-containing protein [Nocardioidaceae bacterium]|nr:Type 1 glutamine amidotransferase-like domain-containing protein [Nocardioidaceae bacterium]
MRLFLSSWYLRAGQRPSELGPADGTGRAGIVLNALDEFGSTRDHNLDRERRPLEELGYACEELDLRRYFDQPDALRDQLDALDLVWAVGGNSFVLARAMVASGFVDIVPNRLADPTFVYGGYSAGSCMAGPDLAGIDLVDGASVVPDGYPRDAEPRCMGLIPFRILPHWQSDHPESAAIDRVEADLSEKGLDYRCLRDGQAFVVADGSVEVRELDAGR